MFYTEYICTVIFLISFILSNQISRNGLISLSMFYLLMLVSINTFPGVETSCDGRINGAQCYGALGGTVVLRLMDRASGIYRYQWVKNKTVILRGRNDKLITNLLETRSSFTPSDGTFRINNLSRTDGGEYTLKSFDLKGHQLDLQILQLNIQGKKLFCGMKHH